MEGFEGTNSFGSRGELNDPAVSAYTAYDSDKDRDHDYWFNSDEWSDVYAEPTVQEITSTVLLLVAAILGVLLLPTVICVFRLGWPTWVLPAQILASGAFAVASAYLRNSD